MKITNQEDRFRELTSVYLDGNVLVISTPKVKVEFDKETVAILKFLSETNFINPMFMINLLGGKQWFKDQIETYKRALKGYEEAELGK